MEDFHLRSEGITDCSMQMSVDTDETPPFYIELSSYPFNAHKFFRLDEARLLHAWLGTAIGKVADEIPEGEWLAEHGLEYPK